MRYLACLLCGLLLTALAVMPAAADELFSVKAGYQVLSPEGVFAARDQGIGTRVDLEKDLPYDNSESLTAEAALQYGPLRLSAGYMPLRFSGTGRLTQSVTFNGQTFSADTVAASDVDVDLYDLGATYFLVNFDDLPVRLQIGPEVAVKLIKADLSFTDQTTGISESTSATAPVPTVGGRVRVGLGDFVGLVGRVGYLQYNDNSFTDIDAQLEFSPVPLFGVYGGYRYFDLQVDESDLFIDARFKGPYAGAFFRF